MKLGFRYLLMVAVSVNFVIGYNTYPRRIAKSGALGGCPSQCQCLKLNSRGTRDLLLMDWAGGEPWYSKTDTDTDYQQDSGDASGRSMICQGLRELPTPLPQGNRQFDNPFIVEVMLY